jgi:hypothetical protein
MLHFAGHAVKRATTKDQEGRNMVSEKAAAVIEDARTHKSGQHSVLKRFSDGMSAACVNDHERLTLKPLVDAAILAGKRKFDEIDMGETEEEEQMGATAAV